MVFFGERPTRFLFGAIAALPRRTSIMESPDAAGATSLAHLDMKEHDGAPGKEDDGAQHHARHMGIDDRCEGVGGDDDGVGGGGDDVEAAATAEEARGRRKVRRGVQTSARRRRGRGRRRHAAAVGAAAGARERGRSDGGDAGSSMAGAVAAAAAAPADGTDGRMPPPVWRGRIGKLQRGDCAVLCGWVRVLLARSVLVASRRQPNQNSTISRQLHTHTHNL